MLSTKTRAASAVLAFTFLIGCGKKTAGPAPRYAILRFENLSGDSSLDWAGRALSEDLARRLDGAMDGPLVGTATLGRVNAGYGGRPAQAPGISGERAAAAGASANRIVTGYLLKPAGGFRLVTSVEDVGTHKIVRLVSASGKSLLDTAAAAAAELAAKPRPGLTANETALQGYAQALEATFDKQQPLLESAVAADPKLGQAWTSLVRVKARKDRADALATADTAIQQKLQPVDIAAIDLETAELRGDRKGRVSALRRYIAASPGDPLLLSSLAEQESSAGEFANAAADWRRILALQPDDRGALNQAGYNYAWAGNYAEAAKTLKEYAQLSPAEANPLDSLGDVNYWFQRWPEAAANYLAAHAKDPKLLSGGDLYKAAWARQRGGDKKGAEDLLNQYAKLRESAGDRTLPVVRADWLYQTGREKEAEAMLRKEGATASDQAQKLLIFGELAVWDLAAGKRDAALADLRNVGVMVTPAIITARFAAQPPASVAEWEARANRWFALPQFAGLRDSALGWALILDGKKEAARKLWEKIAADRPATDFFTRDLVTRLKGEQIQNPAPPDPREVNQFAAVLAKL